VRQLNVAIIKLLIKYFITLSNINCELNFHLLCQMQREQATDLALVGQTNSTTYIFLASQGPKGIQLHALVMACYDYGALHVGWSMKIMLDAQYPGLCMHTRMV
jgi:hypothetical protein